MTLSLTEFSKIPLNKYRLTENYEASYKFLQHDRGIFTEGAVDALLLEAFHAETNGKKQYAEQCVHQGLMIQYCEKLGRDGIGMFFKKLVHFPHFMSAVFADSVPFYAMSSLPSSKDNLRKQTGYRRFRK